MQIDDDILAIEAIQQRLSKFEPECDDPEVHESLKRQANAAYSALRKAVEALEAIATILDQEWSKNEE